MKDILKNALLEAFEEEELQNALAEVAAQNINYYEMACQMFETLTEEEIASAVLDIIGWI